jgi:hypothetical protein
MLRQRKRWIVFICPNVPTLAKYGIQMDEIRRWWSGLVQPLSLAVAEFVRIRRGLPSSDESAYIGKLPTDEVAVHHSASDGYLAGQRHVWLPYKPEAPASEHFATHSLAGASSLYFQRFSRTWRCPVRAIQLVPRTDASRRSKK